MAVAEPPERQLNIYVHCTLIKCCYSSECLTWISALICEICRANGQGIAEIRCLKLSIKYRATETTQVQAGATEA